MVTKENKNLRVPEELDPEDYSLLNAMSELSTSEKRALKDLLEKRTGGKVSRKKGGTISRKKGSKIMKGYKAGGKV